MLADRPGENLFVARRRREIALTGDFDASAAFLPLQSGAFDIHRGRQIVHHDLVGACLQPNAQRTVDLRMTWHSGRRATAARKLLVAIVVDRQVRGGATGLGWPLRGRWRVGGVVCRRLRAGAGGHARGERDRGKCGQVE